MAVFQQLNARGLPVAATSLPAVIDALADRALFDQAELVYARALAAPDLRHGTRLLLGRAMMVAHSKQRALGKAHAILRELLAAPHATRDNHQFAYVSFLQCAANVGDTAAYDEAMEAMRAAGPPSLFTVWSLVSHNATLLNRHGMCAELIDEALSMVAPPVYKVQPGDMPPLGKPLIALVNQACQYRKQLPTSGAYALSLLKSVDPGKNILSHDQPIPETFQLDQQAVLHAEKYMTMFRVLNAEPYKKYMQAAEKLVETIQNPVFASTNPLAVRMMNAKPITHTHRLRSLFVPRTTPYLAMAHIYELAGMREKAIGTVLEGSELNVIGSMNLKRVFERAPAVADRLMQELKEQNRLAEPKPTADTTVEKTEA